MHEPKPVLHNISDLRGGDYVNAYALVELSDQAHANASSKGFWDTIDIDDRRHVLSLLALITTEVSEAVEAVRHDDKENFAEELADVLIRVFDVAGGLDIDLGRAVHDKMAKNSKRPHLHGKSC